MVSPPDRIVDLAAGYQSADVPAREVARRGRDGRYR
jgi:hypothetical protein